jgi:hypothetical protein
VTQWNGEGGRISLIAQNQRKIGKKASEWIFISYCNTAVQRCIFDKIQLIAVVSDMMKIMQEDDFYQGSR